MESAVSIEKEIEDQSFNMDPSKSSTYEMILDSAYRNPDKTALSFFLQAKDHKKAKTYSYRQLISSINQTANFFNELGADKDSVIAYILPNLPETHFVIWGGQATGIVAAINPLLEAQAIAQLLQSAKCKILVTLAPFPGTDLWQKVAQISDQVPTLEHIALINLADHVTGLKGPIAQLMQKKEALKKSGYKGIKNVMPKHIQLHDFNKCINRQNSAQLNNPRLFSKDDYSSFFCTGGTTGIPKIAMRTHGNEVSNVDSVSEIMGASVNENSTLFCGLPLFHVNAVSVTGLMAFSKGAHVILGTPQGYRGDGLIDTFWEMIDHHKINFFSGVPTLYASLLEVPIGTNNIRSLEYGLCGAAPMPREVFKEFERTTGLKILEGYGLTEGTCVSSVNPPFGERRLGSIGLRIPNQDMKVVSIDADGNYEKDCKTNHIGTIVISGPNIFSGYRVDSQNEGLWLDCKDEKKWMNTGDLGYVDKDGYFWLTGRKKELIIRGGHNIDPATIEEPLHQHPSVQLAAAIPRPDIYAGELPVAYVQLKPGESTSEKALLDYAEKHIGERAAIPKAIKIIDEIPLTPVGKIFKPDLKKLEIEYAVRSLLTENDIPITQLEIIQEKNSELILNVKLSSETHKSDAKALLGKFTFKYTFI